MQQCYQPELAEGVFTSSEEATEAEILAAVRRILTSESEDVAAMTAENGGIVSRLLGYFRRG